MDFNTIRQVTDLYGHMDVDTATFQTATGIVCPAGCGQCCENPHIEATPLEMLPLVLELFRTGQVQPWLDQLQAEATSIAHCLFYQPQAGLPGQGRCRIYPWRPTLCRLFGFAAMTDKQGQPLFAACACHKASLPAQIEAVPAAIAAGLPVPNFADWSQQIRQIDPHWGYRRQPIRTAFQEAIAGLGMRWQFLSATDLTPEPAAEG